MDIENVHSILIEKIPSGITAAINLAVAPKFLERNVEPINAGLDGLLLALSLKPRVSCFRATTFPDCDQMTTGSCLTYRFLLGGVASRPQLQKQIRRLTSSKLPVGVLTGNSRSPELHSFKAQATNLNNLVNRSGYCFDVKFQLHALWANALLSPVEVEKLLPVVTSLRRSSDDNVTADLLRRMVLHLTYASDGLEESVKGFEAAKAFISQQESYVKSQDVYRQIQRNSREEVFIHRVTITPTGIYLYGPEETPSNRILRQHRQHHDCFLRVSFADELEDRIAFDRDYSNDRIFQERFKSLLKTGIDIAGEHFDFLGFSHSSLRSQTCWFMRPFMHDGSLLFSRRLISSLGNFSSIRCPAKCAARIGQAFSDTNKAISIEESCVSMVDDFKCASGLFSDGCGTISPDLWERLRGGYPANEQPTLYQIRYKGAKGMLSLDSTLEGQQMRLRPSMVKFKGSPSNDIEVCGHNARPLPFKLNRQIIKILEDLGIPLQPFTDLQEQAVQRLQQSAKSPTSMVDFLCSSLSNSSTNIAPLLKMLLTAQIDVTEDNFLRELLGALLQVSLREIKYRSRILVPDGLTLYGICDETGFLNEGQVYVTWAPTPGDDKILRGRIAITRSPALHPGDIQLADAVMPPDGSPLLDLTNSVVFSRKGTRGLPSMLSGGDLDGDLYNIIYDQRLVPKRAYAPAEYESSPVVDIGREVTSADMAEFFVDFMQNDQLGRIATLHQVFADDSEDEGTTSESCLKLAELHSTAVDFSKSGVKVDLSQIPRAPQFRPDFMAPSASTKVEKGIKREELSAKADLGKPDRYRYYESTKILGHLYRAIDEDIFFQKLENDNLSLYSYEAKDDVIQEIWAFVMDALRGRDWRSYVDTAWEVRNYYESNLLEVMAQYSVRADYITEKEVFIGTILGRSGAASKSQREQSELMKARFSRDVKDIRGWMKEQTRDEYEAGLCLGAACLYIAAREPSQVPTYNPDIKLNSFGWFAASVCFPKIAKELADPDSLASWPSGY